MEYLDKLYYFRDRFTMEEAFILTGISVVVLGVIMGLLLDRLYTKGKQTKTEEDN